MEEKKKENGWLGAIKVAAIIIAVLFTAMIAWWIYLVGSDEYSRAQLEPQREQKVLWASTQTIPVSTWITADVIQVIPRV